MDSLSEWSLAASFVAIIISLIAVVQTWKIQKAQWARDELAVRRDVLRRLVGYRYRLTGGRLGQDGEPFIALNEAWVVFAKFPQVKNSLTKMHMELGEPGRLAENYVSLVQAMAEAARIPFDDVDGVMLERPFTPPKTE